MEPHRFCKRQQRRCLILLSLLLIYSNHIRVSADQRFTSHGSRSNKQTGIFPRGGALAKYTDVLQISQRTNSIKKRPTRRESSFRSMTSTLAQPFVVSDHYTPNLVVEESNEEPTRSRGFLPYILTRKEYDSPSLSKTNQIPEPHQESSGNPIIYRYFGRARSRSSRSDSVPFIIIGPSADHWKIVGKILAARGFNVMVCERTKDTKEKKKKNKTRQLYNDEVVEGEALTLAVLDALKWQKAVLVGCDQEAVLAIEAALRLAPDRVAGLVLCGDLADVQEHIAQQIADIKASSPTEGDEEMNIDSFLRDYVDCPCSIIWDGDASTWSTSHSEDLDQSVFKAVDGGGSRSVIIGGGLAPHRRLPEQFAWTLTRFVENRVSSQAVAQDASDLSAIEQLEKDIEHEHGVESRKQHIVWRDILPPRVTEALDEIFAPGSLLVTGRMIATAIIYLSITRASLFQYHNIGDIRTALLNPKNIRKLLALPGMFLRRRKRDGDEGLENTTADKDSDLSLKDIFQDEVDENEKLQTEPFPEEEEDTHSHSHEEKEAENDDNDFPLEDEPEEEYDMHDDGRNENFQYEDDKADKQLLHKFLFFDQIVS